MSGVVSTTDSRWRSKHSSSSRLLSLLLTSLPFSLSFSFSYLFSFPFPFEFEFRNSSHHRKGITILRIGANIMTARQELRNGSNHNLRRRPVEVVCLGPSSLHVLIWTCYSMQAVSIHYPFRKKLLLISHLLLFPSLSPLPPFPFFVLFFVSFTQMMFGPLKQRPDGTFVFATPIGQGHIPMIALSDLGYFARYTFDHRLQTSGQELEIASDVISWQYLVKTFREVTKQKAVVVHQSMDEWFANFEGVDNPVANEQIVHSRGTTTTTTTPRSYRYGGQGQDNNGTTMTWRENFSGWWALWRDDIVKRDLKWVRSINPKGHTLGSWMREMNYKGVWKRDVLKNTEDGKTISPRWERISRL